MLLGSPKHQQAAAVESSCLHCRFGPVPSRGPPCAAPGTCDIIAALCSNSIECASKSIAVSWSIDVSCTWPCKQLPKAESWRQGAATLCGSVERGTRCGIVPPEKEAGTEVPRKQLSRSTCTRCTRTSSSTSTCTSTSTSTSTSTTTPTDPSSRTPSSYHLHGSGAVVVLRSTAKTSR